MGPRLSLAQRGSGDASKLVGGEEALRTESDRGVNEADGTVSGAQHPCCVLLRAWEVGDEAVEVFALFLVGENLRHYEDTTSKKGGKREHDFFSGLLERT